MTRRRLVGLWVPVLLGLSGCTGGERESAAGGRAGSPTPDETTPGGPTEGPTELTGSPATHPPTVGTSHPALSSTLADVFAAANPAEHARSRGLRVDGSAVLVVVELASSETDLPSGYVRSVERRQGDLVRAYVPFDSLAPLASEDAVRFVRPPLSGSAATGTEGES